MVPSMNQIVQFNYSLRIFINGYVKPYNCEQIINIIIYIT